MADGAEGRDAGAGLVMLVAALVGVQVGMATVASRFVIADTGPIMLGAMRYGVGVLCVLPFLLRSGRMRFASLDIVPITALGLIQFAVLIVFFNIALQHAPAARVALVFSVFPLLTMLLAAILGRERLTGAKTVGVVATIAGVALALGERAVGGIGDASWIGEAAAFGAALCGAVCSVLYRPYLARNPALAVSAYAMLVSAVALLVFAVVTGDVWAMRPLSAIGIAAITFVGVSSGLGFTALLWAYARTSPTRVAIFQPLAPVVASALGWAFLGEAIGAMFLAGLVLVVAGIVLAHRPSQ